MLMEQRHLTKRLCCYLLIFRHLGVIYHDRFQPSFTTVSWNYQFRMIYDIPDGNIGPFLRRSITIFSNCLLREVMLTSITFYSLLPSMSHCKALYILRDPDKLTYIIINLSWKLWYFIFKWIGEVTRLVSLERICIWCNCRRPYMRLPKLADRSSWCPFILQGGPLFHCVSKGE